MSMTACLPVFRPAGNITNALHIAYDDCQLPEQSDAIATCKRKSSLGLGFRLRLRLALICLPLMASTISGCMSLSQEQARKPLINLAENHVGRDRLFDPTSGATYFIPCNPCNATLQKTHVATTASTFRTATAQPAAVSNTALASVAAYPVAIEPQKEMARPEIASAPETMATNLNAADQTYPALADDSLSLKLDTVLASVKRIVPFAFSASATGPRGRNALTEILPLARQSQRISIRGHTDSRGSVSQNQSIAQTRAMTVMKTIIAAGIPQEAVTTSSCTTCYIASNTTEAGRRANRRVEIELVMPAVLAANLPKPIYSAPHNDEGPKLLAKLDEQFNSLNNLGNRTPSAKVGEAMPETH